MGEFHSTRSYHT